MTDTDPPGPGDEPEEQFPRPFGSYLLLQLLAEGGMGSVYHAKHGAVAGIEKLCVVKTLRPHFTADREYTARFIDEARIVVQLSHKNIAGVFDVGKVGRQYYLAMEYISGRDVRLIHERLGELGRSLSEAAALYAITETLDALDYAHRHTDPVTGKPLNLVHRDVSPQNVMVNFEGDVKLIDFGLAASTLKGEKTEPNLVMGKVAYMAPEQARGEDVDGRADLFAVGVVAFELLTGHRYYDGMTPHEIWAAAGSGEHSAKVLQSVSPEMMGILAHALAPDVERRYPTCADFREALETYMFNRGIRSGDGRREMRSLMIELFSHEREAERKLLAELRDMKPLPAAPASKESSRSFAAVTPSGSLQIPPQTGPDLPAGDRTETHVAASSPAVKVVRPGPDTEPTEAHVKAAVKNSMLPLAAGASAFIIVGGVLAAVLFGGSEEQKLPPPDPGVVVAAPDAGPPAAPVPEPKELTPDAGHAPVVKEKPPSEPEPRTRRRTRRGERKPAAKPKPPRGLKKLKTYLRKHCRSVACSKTVLKKANAFANSNPSIPELKALTKDAERCAKKCYGK
jgi:serine/threonine-protein kinase